MSAERPLRIAVCGLGVVGRALLGALAERGARLNERLDRPLRLSMVCSRRRPGPDALTAPARELLASARWCDDVMQVADDPEVDVVVDLMIPGDASSALAKRVLRVGKSLVTANKKQLYDDGDDLVALARRYGGALACEAAVGGGTPMVKTLREALVAYDVRWLWGILNGTSNFVLTRMAAGDGESFEEAVASAQALGYAEADPAADIDGHDAGRKMATLAHLAWGLAFEEFKDDERKLSRKSLCVVTAADVRCAATLGCAIKPVAMVWRAAGGMQLQSTPALLASGHAAAVTQGVENYLEVGDASGDAVACLGPGAGGPQTALAVLADLADLAAGRVPSWRTGSPPEPTTSPITGDYWRMQCDEPDLAELAEEGLRKAGLRLGEPVVLDATATAPRLVAWLSAPADAQCVEHAEDRWRRLVGTCSGRWLRLPLVCCDAATVAVAQAAKTAPAVREARAVGATG